MTLFGLSCAKDISDTVPEDTKDFMTEARSFYENANSRLKKGQAEILSVETETLQPQWDQANVSKTSKYDFAEVPLLFNRQKAGLYNFGRDILTQADKNLILDASFQRLLVYRDKAGTYGQVVISYIPDAEYIKKNQGKAIVNRLDRMESNFSGYLEYRNLSGKLVQLIRYDEGKTVKKYLPGPVKSNSKNAGITTKAQIYIEACVDWYQWSDETGWFYLDSICTGGWVEDSGGSGGVDPDPDPCPTGDCHTGGTGGGTITSVAPPNEPYKLVISFCNSTETTSQVVSAIQANLEAYKTRNCATTYIYNLLNAKNFSINFCAVMAKGDGTYNPTSNTLTFASDYSASRADIMDHEMFHAFQDDFYGNTAQYGKHSVTGVPSPGFVNLEFEQFLMNDLASGYRSAFNFPNATQTQTTSYDSWLTSIVADFSRHGLPAFNSTRYNAFMTKYFYHLGNEYSSPILSDLTPQALYDVFQSSEPDCLF